MIPRRQPSRGCSLVALLLLLGCAGGSPVVARNPILLSSAPPPAGRTCFVSPRPEPLPAGAELVDVAALVDQLQRSGPALGYALVSVRFDEGGRAASVRMIEGTLRGEQIQRQVSRVLKPQPPGPMWSVRIRISVDPVPVLQIGRSEVCPAVPRGHGGIDVVVRREVTGSPSSRPSTSGSGAPRLSILVDTLGQVLQIRVDESSGSDDVDRQFQDALRSRSFHPMLLDGVPVLAWSRWPLPL